jgi:hypothetical protein
LYSKYLICIVAYIVFHLINDAGQGGSNGETYYSPCVAVYTQKKKKKIRTYTKTKTHKLHIIKGVFEWGGAKVDHGYQFLFIFLYH